MKKKLLLFSAFMGITALTLMSNLSGPANSGNGNRTTTGCGGGGCHSGNSSATTATVALVDKATSQPVTNGKYIAGRVYTVAVGGTNTNALPKFGFQLNATRTSGGAQAGSFGNLPSNVHKTMLSNIEYIEHSTSLPATSGVYVTTFDWTAPTGASSVTFHLAINAVNGDNTTTGDASNVTTATFTESSTGVAALAHNLSLTAYPNPAVNSLHLKVTGSGAASYQVAVYDLTGRILLQQTMTGQQTTIPTGNLAAGRYVAVVTSESGRGVCPFTKQ